MNFISSSRRNTGKSPKILFVSSSYPFPTVKGNQRYLVDLAIQLKSMGFYIEFCAIQDQPLSNLQISQILNIFDKALFLYPSLATPSLATICKNRLKSFLFKAKQFFCDLSTQNRGKSLSSIRNSLANNKRGYRVFDIESYCRKNKIQNLILNYVHHAKLIASVKAAKKFILTIDALSTLGSKITSLGGDDSGRALSTADEISLLSVADYCVAIQAEEARYFRQHLQPTTSVITLMHRPKTILLSPQNANSIERKSIGFLAANNPLNRQGIDYFLSNCWDNILANDPECRLVIGGPISDFVIQNFQAFSNIVVLGTLDDVEEFYKQVAICINPVALGSGLKIKSIEAVCSGRPVVSFAEGLVGLATIGYQPVTISDIQPSPFFLANDYNEFSTLILKLLSNGDLYFSSAEACNSYVNNVFSEDAIYSEFVSCLAV
jgi:glycosyltransferase involved in cell wall biosynthesis